MVSFNKESLFLPERIPHDHLFFLCIPPVLLYSCLFRSSPLFSTTTSLFFPALVFLSTLFFLHAFLEPRDIFWSNYSDVSNFLVHAFWVLGMLSFFFHGVGCFGNQESLAWICLFVTTFFFAGMNAFPRFLVSSSGVWLLQWTSQRIAYEDLQSIETKEQNLHVFSSRSYLSFDWAHQELCEQVKLEIEKRKEEALQAMKCKEEKPWQPFQLSPFRWVLFLGWLVVFCPPLFAMPTFSMWKATLACALSWTLSRVSFLSMGWGKTLKKIVQKDRASQWFRGMSIPCCLTYSLFFLKGLYQSTQPIEFYSDHLFSLLLCCLCLFDFSGILEWKGFNDQKQFWKKEILWQQSIENKEKSVEMQWKENVTPPL